MKQPMQSEVHASIGADEHQDRVGAAVLTTTNDQYQLYIFIVFHHFFNFLRILNSDLGCFHVLYTQFGL